MVTCKIISYSWQADGTLLVKTFLETHRISATTAMLVRLLIQWCKGLTQWDRESEAHQSITLLHDSEKEIDMFLNLLHARCFTQGLVSD